MPNIQSQDFPFDVPGPSVVPSITLGGVVTGVPLDGSATKAVTFPVPLLSYITGVNPVFNPSSGVDEPIAWEIIGTPTLTGFVLKATSGQPGTTGTFSYTYTGM